MIYVSAYQRLSKHLAIFLRGRLDTATTAELVREAVQRIDDTLPVYGARMLDETVSASLTERRFAMEILGVFAVAALVLAGLGIYGVVSYAVGERTREIGIRLALGADRRAIMRMVLREGLTLMTAGAAIGIVCAAVVSRAMAGVLFGV